MKVPIHSIISFQCIQHRDQHQFDVCKLANAPRYYFTVFLFSSWFLLLSWLLPWLKTPTRNQLTRLPNTSVFSLFVSLFKDANPCCRVLTNGYSLFAVARSSLQLRVRRQRRCVLQWLWSPGEQRRQSGIGIIPRSPARRSHPDCHLQGGWLFRIRGWRQVRGRSQISRIQTSQIRVIFEWWVIFEWRVIFL